MSQVRSALAAITMLHGILLSAGESSKIVSQWNAALLQAIRDQSTAPCLSSRNLAMAHIAMHDAANAVSNKHPFIEYEKKSSDSQAWSSEQAAISAASSISQVLFPSHSGIFSQLESQQLAKLGERDPAALALGRNVAAHVIAWRANDGSSTTVTFIPENLTGKWRRTPPNYRPPELPHWPKLIPFVVDPTLIEPAPGPPPLESKTYADALEKVRTLGSANSTERTIDQTEIAHFWSCFSYTSTPAGHWNEIACQILEGQGKDFHDSLQLLAILNLTLADAGILAWQTKYQHRFWRPIDAIRDAKQDRNPATTSDPAWDSLLESPPHPEYVSGHSTFTGAGSEILRLFFETDEIAFGLESDSLPGVSRSFQTLSQCETEIGISRVYGGIHFPFSNIDGLNLGQRVAQAAYSKLIEQDPNYVQPETHPKLPSRL